MTTYNVGVAILDIIFENSKPTAANIGGSVLNTVTSLVRTGHPAKFVTSLSNDEISLMFYKFISDNGIDTSYISNDATESLVALAFKSSQTKYEFRG